MIDIFVIAACAALVALGVAAVVHWGDERQAGSTGRLRYLGVSLAAGLVAGVLAAGAGGRLVMGLLALTSPDVHGSFTEAEATIGRVTAGGTLGFILFAGLPAGLLSGALLGLVGPALPRGRAGGLALGAILLVLAGPRLDPLRADNSDFDVLEPAWLAVLSFTALALFQGLVVVAVANRFTGSARPSGSTAFRIAVGVVVVAALPGFVASVTDILA